MQRMIRSRLLSLALCIMMVLSAGAFAEQTQKVTLEDWAGTWNSFTVYMDDKELEEPINKLAAEKGITPEELKAGPAKMMQSEIAAMRVEGNEISFYDNFEDRDGKLLDKATYQFVKTHTLKYGNFEFEMHEFQAAPEAKYPALLVTDVHGEESMTHFHLRYGKDVDTLLAQEDWYPTYVKPTTTHEQLLAGFAHSDDSDDHDHDHGHDHDHDHGHKQEAPAAIQADVSLADWAGEWNNMGAYLDDEQLQAAFEELAKKDGITAKEAKEKYVKKRQCEFNSMVFDGNRIRFLDAFSDRDGKVTSEDDYAYVETYKVKHGNYDMEWHVFKAQGEKAQYPVLLLMDVHGEEALTHFHLRYGTDAQELLAKDGWYPTFVKTNSTYDQLMEEITE